jgi:drug/metabolite transporter (DMT)-like permease
MLGFCIVAPIGDAVAKLIGNSVPIDEVVLIRFAVQAVVLFPLIWVTGRAWRMRGRLMWLTALRTVLHIAGIAAMFAALRFLPLADAIAIVFVMPFFMLILGKFVLNEYVGKRRLGACIVGFCGTLLIVQPSFATVGWPALIPVFVAANFSLFMLVTRQIAKETDPIGLQAVSGIMAVGLMVPLQFVLPFDGSELLQIVSMDAYTWALLIGIGVLGTVAHLLMTWALRFAPSVALAPMQYLEIPIAVLLCLLMFKEIPNALAALGICITMGAGLYIILREQANARLLAAQATQPSPT